MNNKIWVFRLSVSDSGNPKSIICPRVDSRRINEYKRNVRPFEEDEEKIEEIVDDEIEEIVDYDDIEIVDDDEENDNEIFSFLKRELFDHRRLRQGWGYEFENMKLDLNQPGNIWIENYIMLVWRLWGEEISTKNACGRWNILKRMKKMEPGDIVFIPRIREVSNFTIATVDKKYFFHPVKESFTHANVIGVKNIQEYSYEEDFPAKTFAPYQTAISQIKNHHEIFDLVSNFVKESYL